MSVIMGTNVHGQLPIVIALMHAATIYQVSQRLTDAICHCPGRLDLEHRTLSYSGIPYMLAQVVRVSLFRTDSAYEISSRSV